MIAQTFLVWFVLTVTKPVEITNALRLAMCTYYIQSPTQFFNYKYTNGSTFHRRKHVDRLSLVDKSIKSNEHIIKLTNNAQKKIKQLATETDGDSLILKLSVKNGGCKGLQYKLNPIMKDEIEEDDYIQQFEELMFILCIDATSVIYIYNNILDYSNDLINGGFKFINPNATKKCGCGKSFNV
ncbi:iron-sulfur cluster assembly accessory protein [Plasmodium gonderi]|uniref:Iron-sulfur cluster assembly accessory protein n=1 Tax=Plasmodium gonderi TaxID=77519 RepID=A0A1Y1JGF8_PLAGO|nr:iron-sulfur cluster assembly accessory protein [Plasmodium gonderi]GAW81330.1 iron-sulfur cluster assembly accessory protein [Plasmodium gonderi]